MNNYQTGFDTSRSSSTWICNSCGAVNNGEKCSICGVQHENSFQQSATYRYTTNDSNSNFSQGGIAAPKESDRKKNRGMMIWSIAVAILLSRIAGIIAIGQTKKANTAVTEQEEIKYLHSAKIWNIVGCIIGVVLILSQVGNNLNADSRSIGEQNTSKAIQEQQASDEDTNTYMPLTPEAVSFECKELDEDTLIQSEFDSSGALIRRIYITIGVDGPTDYSDSYYSGDNHLYAQSLYDCENHTQVLYQYDSDDRLFEYMFFEDGEFESTYTYEYSNNTDDILVTCYDGDNNLLGSVIYGDDGISAENWEISDTEQILVLKLSIIASFL